MGANQAKGGGLICQKEQLDKTSDVFDISFPTINQDEGNTDLYDSTTNIFQVEADVLKLNTLRKSKQSARTTKSIAVISVSSGDSAFMQGPRHKNY